jgi:hypothetical protein
LAEVSEALGEAQKLLLRLGPDDVRDIDSLDLLARVEAARVEVRSLRICKFGKRRANPPPEWSNLLPWQVADDCEA